MFKWLFTQKKTFKIHFKSIFKHPSKLKKGFALNQQQPAEWCSVAGKTCWDLFWIFIKWKFLLQAITNLLEIKPGVFTKRVCAVDNRTHML